MMIQPSGKSTKIWPKNVCWFRKQLLIKVVLSKVNFDPNQGYKIVPKKTIKFGTFNGIDLLCIKIMIGQML